MVCDVKRITTDCLLSVFVCVTTFAFGGCAPDKLNSGGPRGIINTPRGALAASEMGDRLGLTMQRDSAHSVTMGNRFNSVVLFADPGGVAYVNGRPVGAKGGLESIGGTIYVPQTLERAIRQALRITKKTAPPVKRPQPVRRRLPSSRKPELKYGPVVIDAGHGGRDPGAGYYGYREKDIVLDVALMLVEKLKASGVDARLTRSNDTFIELNDRAAMAHKVGAKLFVSLHCDAAPNLRARGFTIYAPKNRMRQTSSFASAMEKSMLRTSCPALLVEMGYLSNKYDARLLNSSSQQRAISGAIANAVTRYLTK
jgi:N-acetylmuramoyl-L-alanine amidase